MQVKICGITQPEQGRVIATLGATALGFICVRQSPRYVSPMQIRTIVQHLPSAEELGRDLLRVGVFVNSDLTEIRSIVETGHLNAVQLHGQESPGFCQAVRQACPNTFIIKAFRIQDPDSLQAIDPYLDHADALLLDAFHPTQYGGTGKTLDWRSIQEFKPPIPWFLAGGLTPENVNTALKSIHPHGIDLSSGVETEPGIKDLQRVRELFSRLSTAELAPNGRIRSE